MRDSVLAHVASAFRRTWGRPAKAGRYVILATLAANLSCATNPATGQRQLSFVSEEREIAMGQENDAEIRKEMGSYEDRALQDYITSVGMKLAMNSERPNLPWHFTVVDVPAINAFALPGGYIYITRGILPYLDDESQLAGVLGHEIGHVTARHSVNQQSKSTLAQIGLIGAAIAAPGGQQLAQAGSVGLGALFLKYGRDDEAQADQLGVRYASRAGWDPAGIPRMLTTLGRIEEASDSKGVPNWLATHPPADDRVQRVQVAVREAESSAAATTKFTSDHDGYLKRVDGIVWGDNPDQGIVRGSSFLHKGLRFAFDFPSGWTVENGQKEVVAKQPGGRSVMVLEPVPRPLGRTIDDIAIISMQNAGFRQIDGAPTTVNGVAGYLGTYVGALQSLGRVQARVLHLRHDRGVYLIAGLAPVDEYPQVIGEFSKSLQSFRGLSPADAESLRPNRISVYTARSGDTWQTIAERESKGIIKASTLAIMNGHPVNDKPQPDERLKIVIGD
jgi:predicted Zn-dependent protease